MRSFAILFSVLLFVVVSTNAQPPIQWSLDSNQLDSTSYELTVSVTLPQRWHLYGLNTKVEGLSAPTLNFAYENVEPLDSITFTSAALNIVDPIFENKKTTVYEGTFTFTQRIKINGFKPATLKCTLAAFIGSNEEFYPVEQPFEFQIKGGSPLASESISNIRIASIDAQNPIADCGDQFKEEESSSLWKIFLLGFAGGLIALLTPCVFPMIPFTVSYFTNRSANRRAAIRNGSLYGFFILMIYMLLSVPFHIIGNVDPEIFNAISTNAYLNLIFFFIFIYFALSFFGVFEITLPGSLTNSADAKSGLTNLGGIFFMSLTLALVSFSCTGPILGSLLVGSLSGGVWPLTCGLAGFGVALGLPFGLFAVFPQWLKSLPKSGGWLGTVKKVLAFVEVALAFKFLSNADLVMHWGLLKREVFLAIWLLIGLGLAAYLFGILHFSQEEKGQKISIGRKAFAMIALLFSLYLVPGITPNHFINMNLLSGFPPPLSYTIYDKSEEEQSNTLEADVVNDYDKAIHLSDSLNKPLLIDFTGWACVNCRKMEENVWNQPEVNSYIKQNYILVSLYVDDRGKLPIQERSTYLTRDKNKKDIVTHGDKWATFEAENFGQVSQPFYAILNDNARLLNDPIGYTPDVKAYLDWLKCAKESFDSQALLTTHKN